ncbi:MAG: hypothetical protein KG028_00090 [Actinobacteria bacterium]|nr:hypothetical protein [Actinomycetota bacterium]
MTRDPTLPQPPAGLSPAAEDLWWSVIDLEKLDLKDHELSLLREACRSQSTLDGLDEIVKRHGLLTADGQGTVKVHPAVIEARQLRLALARLLASLRLPVGLQAHDEAQPATGVARPEQRPAAASNGNASRASDAAADGRPQRRGAARGLYLMDGGAS